MAKVHTKQKGEIQVKLVKFWSQTPQLSLSSSLVSWKFGNCKLLWWVFFRTACLKAKRDPSPPWVSNYCSLKTVTNWDYGIGSTSFFPLSIHYPPHYWLAWYKYRSIKWQNLDKTAFIYKKFNSFVSSREFCNYLADVSSPGPFPSNMECLANSLETQETLSPFTSVPRDTRDSDL